MSWEHSGAQILYLRGCWCGRPGGLGIDGLASLGGHAVDFFEGSQHLLRLGLAFLAEAFNGLDVVDVRFCFDTSFPDFDVGRDSLTGHANVIWSTWAGMAVKH